MQGLAVIAITLAISSSCLKPVNEIQHTYISDELIVKLKPGHESIQDVRKLNRKYKVREVTKLSGDRRFLLKFPSNTNLNKALDDYKKHKHVESVELNYAYSHSPT